MLGILYDRRYPLPLQDSRAAAHAVLEQLEAGAAERNASPLDTMSPTSSTSSASIFEAIGNTFAVG